MKGMFALRTALDLFHKLSRDLERLRANPDDSDAAFDFFVTAEHIPEWMDPPTIELRKREVILQIVSHVANGAKHFRVSDKRHQSVTSADRRGGYFPGNYFGKRYFGGRYFGGAGLVLDLEGEAAIMFGPSITVLGLAEKVHHYWETTLGA